MAFARTFSVLILAEFPNSFKLFSFLVSFSYRVPRQCLNIQNLILIIVLTHFVPTCVCILIDSYEWVLQDMEVTTKLPFFFNNEILPLFP
jgi:hypothetical protein